MKKSSAVLVLVVVLVFLGVLAYGARSVINFGNLPSYISEPDLTGMIYDLLYYQSWVIGIFSVVIIILLVYLVLLVESLIEAAGQRASERAPAKKRKRKNESSISEKPAWPPPEEDT